MIKLSKILLEEPVAQAAAKAIDAAINSVDENMSYGDFAKAVSIIILDQYGSHNIDPFMKDLHNHLGINEASKNNSSLKSIESISISYTDSGKYYGTYVHYKKEGSSAPILNRSKLWIDEANKLLNMLEINGEIDMRYDEEKLSKIVSQLESKGIQADFDDAMDVS